MDSNVFENLFGKIFTEIFSNSILLDINENSSNVFNK